MVFAKDGAVGEGVTADGGEEAAAGQWRGVLFGEVEKGGKDVDEVGSCGDALVAFGVWMSNDHGNANGAFVEALLLPYTVVPAHFAVVADVDDDGVVAQGCVIDNVEQATDEVVRERDEAVVSSGCCGGDVVGQGFFIAQPVAELLDRGVLGVAGFGSRAWQDDAVGIVAVKVFPRAQEGEVGVHEAGVEEKGTVGVLCAGFEEAFGEVGGCAVVVVLPVFAGAAFGDVAVAAAPVVGCARGGTHIPVFPFFGVVHEAFAKAVQAFGTYEMGAATDCGFVARGFEVAAHCGDCTREGRAVVIGADLMDVLSGHKGHARGYAYRAGGIGVVKGGAFGREAIHVWCFDMGMTITAGDCGVVFVAHDEQDVGTLVHANISQCVWDRDRRI